MLAAAESVSSTEDIMRSAPFVEVRGRGVYEPVLSGCSSIPQVHNAESGLDDVRKAFGLDLPEITSDR